MCFRPGELDIPKKCPKCGHMNDKEEVFCTECGEELPEQNAMPDMPPMPGMPGAPAAPGVPGAPGIPSAPGVPAAPGQSNS